MLDFNAPTNCFLVLITCSIDLKRDKFKSANLSLILKLNSETNSADAVGVGALISDTKSQIVKSIS